MTSTTEIATKYHYDRLWKLTALLAEHFLNPHKNSQAIKLVARRLLNSHDEAIRKIQAREDPKMAVFDEYTEVKRSLDVQRTAFMGPDLEERFD